MELIGTIVNEVSDEISKVEEETGQEVNFDNDAFIDTPDNYSKECREVGKIFLQSLHRPLIRL